MCNHHATPVRKNWKIDKYWSVNLLKNNSVYFCSMACESTQGLVGFFIQNSEDSVGFFDGKSS
jgi:hypothetical protein